MLIEDGVPQLEWEGPSPEGAPGSEEAHLWYANQIGTRAEAFPLS